MIPEYHMTGWILVKSFSYILAGSAYDASNIYDCVFENAHSIPIIDTNNRIGIAPD